MDVTEAELDTSLTESEEDNLLPDPIDCIVQAIKSIHFDWLRCPILRLQNQLQVKDLNIDVFEQNPLFFEIFQQKLYKEFQSSFFWYSPLLQYVTIHNFQWQVRWLWEFLVNTPIDENTHEWLQTLFSVQTDLNTVKFINHGTSNGITTDCKTPLRRSFENLHG